MRQILVTSASTENLFGHMLPYRHFFGINVLSSLYWAQEKAAATKPVSERTRVQAKVSQGGDGLLLAPEQCDDGNVGKGASSLRIATSMPLVVMLPFCPGWLRRAMPT